MSDTRALTQAPKPLGAPVGWSLDLAALGGVTSFLAPFTVSGSDSVYPLVAGLLGALTGAVLGPLMRALFLGPLKRARVMPLLGAGTLTGAAWGGSVAGLAAILVAPGFIVPALACGAVAGALQLGWYWVPHLVRRGKDRSTWPILLGATLLSPGLGYAALYLGLSLVG